MDIDELPEAIIHHILALIQGGVDTKQLTRLGLISKKWLHACSSYEVVDICHTCSYNSPKGVAETEDFIRCIDKTMTRFHDSSIGRIQKLRLHLGFHLRPAAGNYNCLNDQVTNALDNWINVALDNQVEELDLEFKVLSGGGPSEWRGYCIPTRVMSSSVLKTLLLGPQVCLPISNIDHFSLPCCRSLEIFQVPNINTGSAFQRLIKACPCIETLAIDSQYLNNINISGLQHIKMIVIKMTKPSRLFVSVKIDAPTLETLHLSDIFSKMKIKFIDCSNVKHLKLTRERFMYIYKELLSSFPMLETLELYDSCLRKLILENNLKLKKVELKLIKLTECSIMLSCPKETHFLCEIASLKSFFSIKWFGNGPRYFEIVLKRTHPMHIFPNRFRKLRDTMLVTNSVDNFTSLSCKFTWERESYEEKEMVPTHLPACEIDNLTLAVDAPSKSYPVILSRFFSTLHPTTLQASLVDDSDNGKGRDFLKFMCECIINRENDHSTCSACSDHNKCWKHQLTEVKIERIKGPRGTIPSHCDTIFKQLSTLTADQHICFRLHWAA